MRQINKLSDRKIAALRKPGRYSDGQNLYLCLDDKGNRRWTFLFRFDGPRSKKTYEAGLGPYPLISLKQARALAHDGCRMLAAKPPIFPLSVWRRPERPPIPTFGEAVVTFLKDKRWKSDKNRRQIESLLLTHSKPIARVLVNEIDTACVVQIVRPIWAETPVQASRLRALVEAVLDSARALGHIAHDQPNPARWKGHLDLLPWAKQTRSVQHHAALPYAEIPGFVAELRERRRDAGGALHLPSFALEFLILTAARSAEVLEARWNEVDFEKGVWTVPARRMKAGREHTVPLSDAALEILTAMRALTTGALVFSGRKRGKPMTGKSFERLIRKLGREVTAHGFRSGFRDWCGDKTSAPREIAEAALAHAVGDTTERAYRRGSAFEKRALLMANWAAFVTGSNILQLPQKRA